MAMIGGPGKPSQSVPCEHGKPHKRAVQEVVGLSSDPTLTVKKKKKKTCTDRLFPKMGECREVLGGGPAPPSKL